MRIIILVLIIFISLVGCTDYNAVQTEKMNGKWLAKRSADFEFDIQDNQPKNLTLILRHNEDYPFQNLFLITELTAEQDKTFKVTDTLEYKIAYPDGKWIGEGIGGTKEIILGYKNDYIFNKKGRYILKVRQAMRKDTLLGMEDLTLVIKNTK